jgi:2'-5' RNA ligase
MIKLSNLEIFSLKEAWKTTEEWLLQEHLKDVIEELKEQGLTDAEIEEELKKRKELSEQLYGKGTVYAEYEHLTIQTSDIPKNIENQIRALQKKIDKDKLTSVEDEEGWVKNGIQELLHTTILYGINIKDKDKIEQIVKEANIGDINAKGVSYFDPPGKDYSVAIIECESKGLNDLHHKLKENVESKHKYDYKPHITIAYLKRDERLDDESFDSTKFQIKNVDVSKPDGSVEKINLG